MLVVVVFITLATDCVAADVVFVLKEKVTVDAILVIGIIDNVAGKVTVILNDVVSTVEVVMALVIGIGVVLVVVVVGVVVVVVVVGVVVVVVVVGVVVVVVVVGVVVVVVVVGVVVVVVVVGVVVVVVVVGVVVVVVVVGVVVLVVVVFAMRVGSFLCCFLSVCVRLFLSVSFIGAANPINTSLSFPAKSGEMFVKKK
ncbi:unnamed protein product [Angiostrongylus costaricensis]|uniref:ABC transmembrane type-1 domain-containing protein n=1 Tax=Angiostrongylus costaricensis TaxID=334426 RepID=A0A0R3P9I4_ANGCS|nr:unnamed protein product [Angiostrongylus costaricensis]